MRAPTATRGRGRRSFGIGPVVPSRTAGFGTEAPSRGECGARGPVLGTAGGAVTDAGSMGRSRAAGGDAQLAPRLHQIEHHLRRASVAVGRFLLERAGENLPEALGNGHRLRDRVWGLRHHPGNHLRDALAREGVRAGQHLVEDDAEREEIRALVERVSERLLGAQVVERSDDHPLSGLARGRRGVLRPFFQELRETEVEQLHPPVRPDDDVRGRDVAVEDPLLVRRLEAVEHLDADVEALVQGEAPLLHDLVDGEPLEVLEDEVEEAGREPGVPRVREADVVNRDDVRVVDPGHGPRLVQEPSPHLLVGREGRRQDLDRDLAAERRIGAEIDLSHPAPAQESPDLIAADARWKGFGGHPAIRV